MSCASNERRKATLRRSSSRAIHSSTVFQRVAQMITSSSATLTRPMTRQELLANIPLFESLTPDDLDALAKRIEEAPYEEGDIIFKQGDKGESLFLIDDGAVEISYGEGRGRLVLSTLFAGEYFGELSLFDGA